MPMSQRELAQHLLEQIDAVRANLPNTTLDALLKELNLRRIDAPPPSGGDGLYSQELGAVFLNPSVRVAERRIFTGFHEGTHAIVRRDATIRDELAELCPSDEAERPIIELLCNIGAAEFLMPRARFVPLLRSQPSLAECIERAEREFPEASLPALAQQIAHYASPPGMVLICAHAPIPREGGFERARTHIQYSFVPPVAGTGRVRPRPKRFQVIRDDHPIAGIVDHRRPYDGDTYYPYSTDARIPCWCEAVWHTRSQRVVAILRDRAPRRAGNEQPALAFE